MSAHRQPMPHLFPLLFILFVVLPFHSFAQVLVNGQIFTLGLSIIDSPALNTPFHAGSNIPIAIELSGDGKLSSPSFSPGSGLPTRYDELEIYLVSSQTGLNLTVSQGTGLLTQENGTVRHLNWPVPICISNGQYNLTFYETSHINNQGFLIITPIPISIDGGLSEKCESGVNPLSTQPQLSSPPSQSPFLPGQQAALATITLSNNKPFPPTNTANPTLSSSSVTLVIVSVETITTTSGVTPITTKSSTTWTTTAVMNTQDLSGFIPVNAGISLITQTSTMVFFSVFSLWHLFI